MSLHRFKATILSEYIYNVDSNGLNLVSLFYHTIHPKQNEFFEKDLLQTVTKFCNKNQSEQQLSNQGSDVSRKIQEIKEGTIHPILY